MSVDSTVEGFFTKNATEGYAAQYRLDHSPRLVAMLCHFMLTDMKGKRVADVGGGLGFLGECIDRSNDYWVFDGAETTLESRVCKGTWAKVNLQRDDFGTTWSERGTQVEGLSYITWARTTPNFDIAFCCETLEHLSDPYHCLEQIKKMVKPDGDIIISIPDETVWHNVVYCGLLWPRQNFEQFLGQMALPVKEFWHYKPKNRGWPAYHFHCTNASWDKKVMAFPKTEEKFKWATPLEMTNL